MKFQFRIRDILVLTGCLAAVLSSLCAIKSRTPMGNPAWLFCSGVIALTLVLMIATPLYFIRRGIHAFWDWLDDRRQDGS